MTFLGKLLGLLLDGRGGGGGVSQFFESYNFLFHSFLRLLRTYMPMTAKQEGQRELSGVPLNTKSLCRQLPEYRSLSIS